jgi:hypothetical protein
MPKRKEMMGDVGMGKLKAPKAAKVSFPKMAMAKVKLAKPRLGKTKRG